MPQPCLDSINRFRDSFQRVRELILEHERQDKLIDDLYFSVGSKLNTTFELDELLGVIIDSLEKLIGFDAAGVFLVNQESAEIEADFIRGYNIDYLKPIRQKVGEGVLGWVIENRKSAILNDVEKDDRYINARPQTRSEAAVPLISEGRVIGCIDLESDAVDAFREEDLTLLETFATQASLAVERARLQAQIVEKKMLEEEVALARKIQLSLLPDKPPRFDGYELAGMNLPSRAVGGDYYDFIPFRDGGLGLAIADVSGKGVGAALTMSGFRAAIRAEVRHQLPPTELMHKVNHFVYESTGIGDYVTAFFAVLRGNRLKYINAGHNPPILMKKSGEFELLEIGGMILGFLEEQYFDEGAMDIKTGDSLLLYTDGVVEALNSNGVEFGVQRLVEAMREMTDLKTEERIKAIHRKVMDFSGKLARMDDITLMMLKRK